MYNYIYHITRQKNPHCLVQFCSRLQYCIIASHNHHQMTSLLLKVIFYIRPKQKNILIYHKNGWTDVHSTSLWSIHCFYVKLFFNNFLHLEKKSCIHYFNFNIFLYCIKDKTIALWCLSICKCKCAYEWKKFKYAQVKI